MTLQECYAAFGGDYEGVVARLRSEKTVKKFALKFLNDKSYGLLCSSLEKGDYGEAFRASHTLKGLCQNLGFSRLLESSTRLTEALRYGWSAEAAGLIDKVADDYRQTARAIQQLDE